jgi:uncharacterized protein YkwD
MRSATEPAALVVNRSRLPRHTVARAVGLAGTALMAAALLAGSPQPATGWNQGSAEATLFQLMNGARVNNGLRAVQQHSTLVSLARWRSKDQVDRDYFDHYIQGTGYQVYHWYDLNGLQYSWGGENIGWNNGYSDGDSPIAIHNGFMASPDHRHNILDPSFTHGGVGAYARDNVMFLGKMRNPRFYTELFMTAASTPPPPPPDNNPPPPPSGAGGGSTSPSGPAATKHERSAKAVRVDAPAAPRASDPLDGPSLLAGAPEVPAAGIARKVAFIVQEPSVANAAAAGVATHFRVEAAVSPERGLFETVMGSLLGFVL